MVQYNIGPQVQELETKNWLPYWAKYGITVQMVPSSLQIKSHGTGIGPDEK